MEEHRSFQCSSPKESPAHAFHHPPREPGPSRPSLESRLRGWLTIHPVVFAVLALLWLILRTGRKPTRITYPCQQAAMGTASLVLAAPLVHAIARGADALGERGRRIATVTVLVLLMAIGGFAVSGRVPIANGVAAAVAGWMPAMAAGGGAGLLAPDEDYRATIYVLEDAGGPAGNHHLGLDQLIACMGDGGLKFYRSPTVGPESGPDGVVGADHVVLIKINSQWGERGGTNTDVLKGLIARVIEHPDGFTGEVVVVENTQDMGTLDWPYSNAENPSQSALDVINLFAGLGLPVSGWLWDPIRSTQVNEYSDGDLRDGYVVGPYDPGPRIRVSYPKFQTAEGVYVSLKHGIWDPGSSSYDQSRLTFLNLPVLKCHGYQYGVTACLKHHVGTMTTALSTNTHAGVRYGAPGAFLAEVRMADLNILDCIYILARPNSGPWCSYSEATRVDKLVSGFDPVAIDIWATKHILVPTILANGYTEYPMQNPDDPGSIFRLYLDLSMSELLAAGIEVTNDLASIDAEVCSGTGVGPIESPVAAARRGAHPNPSPSGATIRFDMRAAGGVRLDIYDATGRLVRSIHEAIPEGAGREIRWDGKDQSGRTLPAGAYHYRFTGAGEPSSGKVTIVR